jgi:hypothetical protein
MNYKIRIILVIYFCFFLIKIYANQDTIKPWKLKSIFSLNGTQSSFVNWNAGGRNNASFIGSIRSNVYYTDSCWKWMNDLNVSFGAIKYLDNQPASFQKTDDKIDFSSIVEYKFSKKVFLSFFSGLKTQMIHGYVYPNDSVIVSSFMAPGYLNLAVGLVYSPKENFSIFTSFLSEKSTFVLNDYLSNLGVFGVGKGKKSRQEYGAYVRFRYNANIMKNIEMRSKLELFNNYLVNPQNIDVNAELIFNFKINSIFSALAQWNLIYDDDVKIRDNKGNIGPRTQFKSVLGIGISYKIENN